jgi:hypothetical protein
MVLRQLGPRILGVLGLSLLLGIAAGWIVAKETSVSFGAAAASGRITATPMLPRPTSTGATQARAPARSSDELLRPLLGTAVPATSTPVVPQEPTSTAPSPTAAARPPPTGDTGQRATTPTAEQGKRCVVTVTELRVRQEPGGADERTVIGGLPRGAEVRILDGPLEVAGSQHRWVHIESASIRPAHVHVGWVAYDLLRCA